jgi:hypothetical protein
VVEEAPEKRIADLERELAQQRRIAELERQLAEAKATAGDSPGDEALQHARVTVKNTRVVYGGMGSRRAAVGRQAAFRARRPQRVFGGAGLGALAGLFGICVGAAAALTAVFPATALWASAIVCRSPYHLDYSTSHYSYRPGQSGTSVSFQCVNGDAWYGVNEFALMALQSLLSGLVVSGIVTAAWLIRRQVRTPG